MVEALSTVAQQMPMKVLVIVPTYNDEKFIAEAINGILMQEVNFAYEIVIIEDCSTDGTRDMVIDFQKRYSDKIRLILEDSNKNDNVTWGREILGTKSEYIALLDGDDYWSSPHKLQKQVDFLDNHKECSICFHDAYNLYPDGRKVRYSQDVNYEFNKPTFTLEDILCQNFLPTCSVVFRKGLFDEFPKAFYDAFAGDWFLHVLNAQYDDIGYINEIWGMRRVHEGGLISMKSDREVLELRTTIIKLMNTCLNNRYSKRVNEKLYSYHYQICHLAFQERNVKSLAIHATHCLVLLGVHYFSLLHRLSQRVQGRLSRQHVWL